MGSILNYVFESDVDTPNGKHFCNSGPFRQIIINKNYSTSNNLQIKEGFKNLLWFEVNHPDKFLDYIISNKDIFNLLERDDFKIVFSMIADPSYQRWYDENYEKILNSLNNKVIFIDTNVAIKQNIFKFHFFLEEIVGNVDNIFTSDKYQEELKYKNEKIELNDLDKFRFKKFLCFNRIIQKYHRFKLFLDWGTNDFSDSYFSFLNKYESGGAISPQKVKELETEYGLDYCKDMYKKLPIELDTQQAKRNNNIVEWNRTHNNFKKELFVNSCINIVTETSFEDNELFISEKVLKPIIGYQPFIVFGGLNYLKELKNLGFKTFNSVWDESYDEIEDFELRYDAIIKLILDLNKKTIEELNEIYKSVKNICIYNRKHLNKIKNNSLENILKIISNEW